MGRWKKKDLPRCFGAIGIATKAGAQGFPLLPGGKKKTGGEEGRGKQRSS